MPEAEQKKYIADAVSVRLHEVKAQWAKNWIARKINQGIVENASLDQKKRDTAQREVDACDKNMAIALQEIENFEWIAKTEKLELPA